MSIDDERFVKFHPNYSVSNHGRIRNDKYDRFIRGTSRCGYKRIVIGGRRMNIHLLVAKYFVENPDDKPFVDHIDHNRSNNHYSNLRYVTRSENGMNRLSFGAVNYKCVSKSGDKYRCMLTIDGNRIGLGTHETPLIAYKCWLRAVNENNILEYQPLAIQNDYKDLILEHH